MEEALEQDLFDELMVEKIEPRLGLGKPSFLYDYPSQRGALARLRRDDPTLAERFELYVGGLELANAFSELTDPEEQRKRFQLEEAYRRSKGKPPYPLPEKFLSELEEMPPSAGAALGVDRLVMTFLDAETIDEVVAFTPEDLSRLLKDAHLRRFRAPSRRRHKESHLIRCDVAPRPSSLRRTSKYASLLRTSGAPATGFRNAQLASACLPIGRGIFEQPAEK